MLWPRWPGSAVAPDAPSLPITIGGVLFNVRPAAIRIPIQRYPGAQLEAGPGIEPQDLSEVFLG